MKCPVCENIDLLTIDKNWVEIDYCPQCKWIWLDRWELEKLIQFEKWYNESDYQNEDNSDIDTSENNTKSKKSFFENFLNTDTFSSWYYNIK